MINRVVLVGRLAQDPELKNTATGNSVCSFSVAVSSRTKNPDGTWGTIFVPCVCFQQTADNLVKRTKKGSMVGIEGRLNVRTFKRADDSNGRVMEVVCDSIQFLSPKAAGEEGDEAPTFDDIPAESQSGKVDSIDLPDDDLPF